MVDRSVPCAPVAGLAYFALVFAAGFALGTLRVLVLIPQIGEISAVLLELPLLLALAWVACRWLVRRLDVPAALSARSLMGGLAFAMLMIAELGVSILGFGRTFSSHLERFRQLPELLGLAAQMVFAALPIIQSRCSQSSCSERKSARWTDGG